jgi:hypothetical protein
VAFAKAIVTAAEAGYAINAKGVIRSTVDAAKTYLDYRVSVKHSTLVLTFPQRTRLAMIIYQKPPGLELSVPGAKWWGFAGLSGLCVWRS